MTSRLLSILSGSQTNFFTFKIHVNRYNGC